VSVRASERVTSGHVEPQAGSQLALSRLRLPAGTALAIDDPAADTLLFVSEGEGLLTLGGESHPLREGTAALVLTGEQAEIRAGDVELAMSAATVGGDVDLHAPIGPRAVVTSLETAAAGTATGSRSFQVLFGPESGSVRATLFAGFIPPGKAPWHYHLYDEIVWVYRGGGRLHLGDDVMELRQGSAFRLCPRDLHIVENTSRDAELAVLGIFTPAGSPSAAYLPPGSTYEYGIGAR
jgi:quercetin dioxygenase-like cupin family protein